MKKVVPEINREFHNALDDLEEEIVSYSWKDTRLLFHQKNAMTSLLQNKHPNCDCIGRVDLLTGL